MAAALKTLGGLKLSRIACMSERCLGTRTSRECGLCRCSTLHFCLTFVCSCSCWIGSVMASSFPIFPVSVLAWAIVTRVLVVGNDNAIVLSHCVVVLSTAKHAFWVPEFVLCTLFWAGRSSLMHTFDYHYEQWRQWFDLTRLSPYMIAHLLLSRSNLSALQSTPNRPLCNHVALSSVQESESEQEQPLHLVPPRPLSLLRLSQVVAIFPLGCQVWLFRSQTQEEGFNKVWSCDLSGRKMEWWWAWGSAWVFSMIMMILFFSFSIQLFDPFSFFFSGFIECTSDILMLCYVNTTCSFDITLIYFEDVMGGYYEQGQSVDIWTWSEITCLWHCLDCTLSFYCYCWCSEVRTKRCRVGLSDMCRRIAKPHILDLA